MTNGFTAVLNPTSQLIAASVGIPGPAGSDGADGSQWFTGTGAPAPALGNPGDMYLENDGDVWQSNDVSGWLVTPTNIRGPVGATGATGATGSAGAQGPAGSVSSVGSNLLFTPDNTYDVGASGASRPRTIYAGTSVITPLLNTPLLSPTGNVVEQRNGTSAQSFRLYKTYTDASNYERVNIDSWAGGFAVQTSRAGTGVAQPIYLGVNGTAYWGVNTSGHFVAAVGDNQVDIGVSPTNRPRNLYLAGTATVGGITTPTISNAGNITVSPTGYLMLSVTGEIYINSAGGTRLQVGSNYVRTYQNFTFSPDNTIDIGIWNGLRPRNLFAAGAVATGTKAGITVDADVDTPIDGMLRVDTTNHRLYVRDGGTWRYAALT